MDASGTGIFSDGYPKRVNSASVTQEGNAQGLLVTAGCDNMVCVRVRVRVRVKVRVRS